MNRASRIVAAVEDARQKLIPPDVLARLDAVTQLRQENERLRAALREIMVSPEKGSIGSINNVRRSQWINAERWNELHDLAWGGSD